jgi:hypothetical protein
MFEVSGDFPTLTIGNKPVADPFANEFRRDFGGFHTVLDDEEMEDK